MIRFALQHCDQLTVLVCCSDREPIACDIRSNWIRETFSGEPRVDVLAYRYSEADLPNTSETSLEVSKIWSKIFLELLPDQKLLVTSEPYGELVASIMGIRHIAFDLKKQLFPVSATAIRSDLLANWEYLPDSVKPYFCIKVAILGTESTGKTTLATALAQHYGCGLVLEAARGIIQSSKSFDMDLLHEVAMAHATAVEECSRGHHPLILLDTDLLTTKSYARLMLGRELVVAPEIEFANQAQCYLYLRQDVPHVQDGTRLDAEECTVLDRVQRALLLEKNLPFTEITGSWESRFVQAKAVIDVLLDKQIT